MLQWRDEGLAVRLHREGTQAGWQARGRDWRVREWRVRDWRVRDWRVRDWRVREWRVRVQALRVLCSTCNIQDL